MDETGFFYYFYYFIVLRKSYSLLAVNTCEHSISKLGMARQDMYYLLKLKKKFKKLISELHNNEGGTVPPNFDIWLCIFTAEKRAVRISTAISKTGPGGLSRQHCLFLPGKLPCERTAPAASRWERCTEVAHLAPTGNWNG